MAASHHLFAAVGIMSLATAIYWNALDNPFYYDDYHSFVLNPAIHKLDLSAHFASRTSFSIYPHHQQFRPLVQLSYAVNYYLGTLDPWGYHLLNLIFHGWTSILIYWIAVAICQDVRAGIFAGLVFTLHPFNSEAVNYITARSTVMCTFFYLLAFVLFVAYRDSRAGLNRVFLLAGCLVNYGLALLSKEMAVTLPAIFMFYDLVVRMPGERKFSIQRILPHALVIAETVIYLIITHYIGTISGLIAGQVLEKSGVEEHPPPASEHGLLSLWLTSINMLGRYIQLMIFPVTLHFSPSLPISSTIFSLETLISLILLGTLIVIAWWDYSSSKIISFWIAWIYVTTLPVLLLPWLTQHALFQENRGYLSAVGFAMILGLSFLRILEMHQQSESRWYRTIIYCSLSVVLISYGIITVKRNLVWGNEVALWQDSISKSPQSYVSHFQLGLALEKRGDLAQAREHYAAALKIQPDTQDVEYTDHGWIEREIYDVQRQLRDHAGNADLHLELGQLYQKIGQIDWAIQEYKDAMQMNPADRKVYANLGVAYYDKGWMDQAIGVYEIALRMEPNDPTVHNNLGNALKKKGEIELALAHYEEATRLQPDYPLAHFNLAQTNRLIGRTAAAVQHFTRFLELTEHENEYQELKKVARRELENLK